jgi:carboxyl-terminal processing protease
MILSGIKALYQAAGVPVPAGLSRRVSALATPEQLAAFLADAWPKTTAKPVAAKKFEETLLDGLLDGVPGGASLVSAKERAVHEQFEGNRYVGIHITLGLNQAAKRPQILQVFEGGPADRAGVKPNDVVETIDGVDTQGMELRDAVDRLRGAEGTAVTIKVRQPRESRSRTMKITRGRLPHATVQGLRKRSSGGWDVRLDGPDPLGYLRVTEISASTPHELRQMARQLESAGIQALVLDLRALGGNSAHTAVLLADSLLERGPIGRIRTAKGETAYQADPDALFRGWPIVVLVDSSTWGTAEWLAAALQDNHRAILVGAPTASASRRGSSAIVRSTLPVGDGAWSITLATGRLERGDGRPLGTDTWGEFPSQPRVDDDGRSLPESKTGVKPDHLINGSPMSPRRLLPGVPAEPIKPASDPALQKAVQLLRQSLRAWVMTPTRRDLVYPSDATL